jgi:HEAT repeat protein
MQRTILVLALLALAVPAEEDKALREAASELAARMRSKDPEERLAAARETAMNQHHLVLAPLVKLLRDKDKRIREAAISSLGLRDDPKAAKQAASALASRLRPLAGKEETREELLSVIQALHDLAQPVSMKALLDIKSGTDREVMRARAMAVANVPSKEAIDRLIQYGYKDRRGSDSTRRIAIQALGYATQVRLRGNFEEWRRWWSDNKDGFDVDAAAEARANKRAEQAAKAEKKAERERKRRERKKKGEGE